MNEVLEQLGSAYERVDEAVSRLLGVEDELLSRLEGMDPEGEEHKQCAFALGLVVEMIDRLQDARERIDEVSELASLFDDEP